MAAHFEHENLQGLLEPLCRKLAVIAGNLQALKPIEAIDLTRYRADIFTRKGTERLLQELIEAALDLNMHLLAQTVQ